jgi:hypothetical protein
VKAKRIELQSIKIVETSLTLRYDMRRLDDASSKRESAAKIVLSDRLRCYLTVATGLCFYLLCNPNDTDNPNNICYRCHFPEIEPNCNNHMRPCKPRPALSLHGRATPNVVIRFELLVCWVIFSGEV